MSNELELAARIKRLKSGESFFLQGAKARRKALQMAKTLKQAGVIKFDLTTREIGYNSEYFKVIAL